LHKTYDKILEIANENKGLNKFQIKDNFDLFIRIVTKDEIIE